MKKFFILCLSAMAIFSLQNCTKSGTTPEKPGGEDPEMPVEKGESIQAANKNIALPAENFPAIDVYSGEDVVTEFTLLEGNYKASRNGVEFNGDDFASGVVLMSGDVVTIEQDGVTLVSFAPKTGGEGAKIKILGIGSTTDLTNAEGIGRGIYEFVIPEGAADDTGMIKGGYICTDGNMNNTVTKITLEGGVDYLMRRDHLTGDVGAEGWAVAPADLGSGFTCDDTQMISIYPKEALDDASVKPLYSAGPKKGSGNWDFRLQRFVKKIADNNDDKFFRVQGCGEINCWFRIGNGCNGADYEFTYNGIPEGHETPDPYARVFGPAIQFALYICDHNADFTEADLATPEQVSEFISEEGLDPGDKYVALKVLNPETEVNTHEPLEFVWKRKAATPNRIRFEGLSWDEENNCLVLVAGMTIRTSDAEGNFA